MTQHVLHRRLIAGDMTIVLEPVDDVTLIIEDQAHVASLAATVKVVVTRPQQVAHVVVLSLAAGSRTIHLEMMVTGEGAQAFLAVVTVAHATNHKTIVTKMQNNGRHTRGYIEQRGLVMARSQVDFKSVGQIFAGAVGADAQQTSRLLMLDETATGSVDPILLIDENDVLAGHAASVGQVNQTQLLYLLSRGIAMNLAQQLVTRGFMAPALVSLSTTMQQRVFTELEEAMSGETSVSR